MGFAGRAWMGYIGRWSMKCQGASEMYSTLEVDPAVAALPVCVMMQIQIPVK